MKDTIYREDAIKAVRSTVAQYVPFLNEINMTLPLECETALRSVPSADRPQGEWFKDENGDYRCSECGGCEEQFIYGTENWYGLGESKFCPSCGARMRGADYE